MIMKPSILCEPLPAKVKDCSTRKRAGEAIDNILNYYGFKIYKRGCFFALEEEGNHIQIVSYVELIKMSMYLLEKTLRAGKINPVLRVKMEMSYKHLRKLKEKLQDEKTNRICLKCGTEGNIIRMDSASLGRKISFISCPCCGGSDASEVSNGYKSNRNL